MGDILQFGKQFPSTVAVCNQDDKIHLQKSPSFCIWTPQKILFEPCS